MRHFRRCVGLLALGGLSALACATVIDRTGSLPLPDESQPAVVAEVYGAPHALEPRTSKRLIEQAAGGMDTPALDRMLAMEHELTGRPLVAGNSVRLLVDGPAAYDAMFGAIVDARHEVDLETYTLGSDRIGRRLADLLVDRRAHGVTVRILYDGLGSAAISETFLDRLRAAGAELREFNPIDPPRTAKVWTLDNRDHRKILVVDGRIGFTGGMNISGVYERSSFAPSSKKDAALVSGWRDTHIEIQGPAVAELQKLFLEQWKAVSGEAALEEGPLPVSFPFLPRKGTDLVRIISSEGGGDGYEIYGAYLLALQQARHRAWVTQAYFVPGERMIDALKAAARRGVDVRLLVPGECDHPIVLAASRAYYEDLLENHVRIYERKDAMVHAKTAVIDGVWSTVGSSNLDYRSFLHNDEANAVVVGRDLGEQMEELFLADVAHATEVTPEAWAHRPITERVREEIGRLFRYWL